MKHLALLLLLLLVPTLAWADGPWDDTQALTRGDPPPDSAPTDLTNFPTRPMTLSFTRRYRVGVCAIPPATLSGAGKVRLWLWHPRQKRWGYNPDGDLTVTVASGTACQFWGKVTDVQLGHLLPATQGITVSAGTTVRVSIDTDGAP